MNAVLSNPNHPEYGVATVPYPIPDEEYDHILKLLAPLEIGDYVERDCKVEELIGFPPVMDKLKGTQINLDDLDFLAQQLDSFDGYEIRQFQALAYLREAATVAEFLNVSFNSQTVTVISDFADLDGSGRKHYLTTHGGCASVEEMDQVDGRAEILKLMEAQKGAATPYGLLFENAPAQCPAPKYVMPKTLPWLEIVVGMQGRQDFVVALPMSEQHLERLFRREKLDINACSILDYSSTFPDQVDAAIDFGVDSIPEINQLCRAMERLQPADLSKLTAVAALAKPVHAAELMHLAEHLEEFEFFPKVFNAEQYGRYMIRQSGDFLYDPNLEDFYDYEGYARCRMAEYPGKFTEYGYTAYLGQTDPEMLMREDAAEVSPQEMKL